MSIYSCLHCSKKTSNLKFCSRSCSASFNNKGIRRHGNASNNCLICGQKTKSCREKYCSIKCSAESQRKNISDDVRKRKQRYDFMKYYTKKLNQTPVDADFEKIKQIYLECPEGYEVDHIIPISKGGLHHQDNLQYLTISENRKKSNKLNY